MSDFSPMTTAGRAAEMREFFNRKADGYDTVHAKFAYGKALLSRHLPDGAKNILDLGAGTGMELIPLFEEHPDVHVTAVDIAEEMLAALAARPFADKVTIICGDFFETDFGSGYDAVISTSALHHFLKEDKARLYRKIADCLTYKGFFLNCDEIADDKADEAAMLKAYYDRRGDGHHVDTPLAVSTEIELMENAGFHNFEVYEAGKRTYRFIKAQKITFSPDDE